MSTPGHVIINDPQKGGFKCLNCGVVDNSFTFPVSKTELESKRRVFMAQHKDCKKAGPVWECINPMCPVKSEKCVSAKEPVNKNGKCRRAKVQGQDFHTIWQEVP